MGSVFRIPVFINTAVNGECRRTIMKQRNIDIHGYFSPLGLRAILAYIDRNIDEEPDGFIIDEFMEWLSISEFLATHPCFSAKWNELSQDPSAKEDFFDYLRDFVLVLEIGEDGFITDEFISYADVPSFLEHYPKHTSAWGRLNDTKDFLVYLKATGIAAIATGETSFIVA